MNQVRYPCPVCGFEMHSPASDYHICPQCGTEFDNDDQTHTHEELRALWIEGGRRFWWYEKAYERLTAKETK